MTRRQRLTVKALNKTLAESLAEMNHSIRKWEVNPSEHGIVYISCYEGYKESENPILCTSRHFKIRERGAVECRVSSLGAKDRNRKGFPECGRY